MSTDDTAARETAERALVLLESALDVLDERGWCQHQLSDDAGRVCLFGSFISALARLGRWHTTSDGTARAWAAGQAAAIGRLRHTLGVEDPTELIVWQDEPDRTVEDVKLALKYAIAGDRL